MKEIEWNEADSKRFGITALYLPTGKKVLIGVFDTKVEARKRANELSSCGLIYKFYTTKWERRIYQRYAVNLRKENLFL
jgi:hypothetical protein